MKFWYIYGRIFAKYLHGTWFLLNILMIFDIKEKSIILIHTMYFWLLQIYLCYLWPATGHWVPCYKCTVNHSFTGLIASIKRLFHIHSKVSQNKTEQIKCNDINKNSILPPNSCSCQTCVLVVSCVFPPSCFLMPLFGLPVPVFIISSLVSVCV